MSIYMYISQRILHVDNNKLAGNVCACGEITVHVDNGYPDKQTMYPSGEASTFAAWGAWLLLLSAIKRKKKKTCCLGQKERLDILNKKYQKSLTRKTGYL